MTTFKHPLNTKMSRKNKLSSFKEMFIWTCCVDGETDIPSTRLQNKTQVSLLTRLDQGSGRVTEDALLRQRTTLQPTSSIATSKSTDCPNTAAHPNRTMPNQRLRAGWGLEQAWCQHAILKTWVWGAAAPHCRPQWECNPNQHVTLPLFLKTMGTTVVKGGVCKV